MLGGLGLSDAQIGPLLELVEISSPDEAFAERVRALGVTHELLDEGLEELLFVMRSLTPLPAGAVVANMGIVRGFDYYTGTVYETVMDGHESIGAIASGGRYDNLAAGAREPLPGVGISIGVSRILGRLFGQGLLPVGRKTPTVVLVALPSDDVRAEALAVTRALRERGIPAEAYHEPAKLKKQLSYASAKGIPFTWLPFEDGHVVRDMTTGEQVEASEWNPS
jgi:histidyl-tRNA synthetase